MKTCNTCKIEKNLYDFYKMNASKDGHSYKCKSCVKQYDLDNREKKSKRMKIYYIENKEKATKRNQQWHLNNKEKHSKLNQNWEQINKEKRRKQKKQYYLDNKEKIKQYQTSIQKKINERIKIRKKINPLFKLRCIIGKSIYTSIKNKGYTKQSKTYEILGCDFETFKLHLEKQFTKGMSWDNHGKWHLDHIYPVSLARDEQHLIELNHYTNFQPLWAFDNLSKGNKIIEKQLFLI